MTVLEADLTWLGGRFERGIQVAVKGGWIAEVGRLGRTPDQRLAGRALLPGFVNAHSHAFQRGLRGFGETFPGGQGSFWTWRAAMYDLVGSLDADGFRELCAQAFREMRRAGITCLGEFHYFHHATGDADYALDEVILEAAAAVDLRMVLLNAYYATGGIGRPLAEAQRRFRSENPDAFWKQMDHLGPLLDPETQALGAVVHSVRAASRADLRAVAAEAHRRGMVLHLHLEEQRQEIEECVAAHGKRPMAVLLEDVDVRQRVTAVHCTHTDPEEMREFRGAGGRVCVCPLTEANLGDGLCDLEGIGAVSLGTDSNARISMVEEMRWLEYGQRLKNEARGVARDEHGRVATTLLKAATEDGATALGVPAGAIDAGKWADFIALDLACPTLEGWTDATLLESFLFGAGEEAIAATALGGVWTEYLPA